MGIFQNSVLRNTKQDESILAHRWASFQDYLSKIEAIKDFKEEIYQDGFLHDVFEKCLGYTLKTTNPNNYSLDREQKNETDGKKADAAIFIDRNSLEGKASNASLQQTAHGTGAVNDKIVVGVIELKDQKSKNLDVIEAQAFGYHASHANSRYIIISNFDELRFYIDKKSYYEKFNLFNLDFDEFRKLHLILSYESISSGLTNRLLEQSNRFEVDISKKLYSDFSDFRTHLFENIVKNNYVGVSESVSVGEDTQTQTQTHTLLDKQTLLRLTQKLCDRLIFILFAEDRGLLRPNTIKEIREEFKNQKFTSYTLYDIYKFYFDAISSGNERLDIQKYNGGLFAKDELLDSLKIDDEQIDLKAQKLSDYDFMSDIGVNILGHIFEQSLTDLEEMEKKFADDTAITSSQSESFSEMNLVGALPQPKKTINKRKKDGVFYTPEYITRYIVENTLGKLCTDKKAELNIIQIEPPKDSRKPTKKEQATKANLEIYRNWLLELKILDPACGSGAFLNQALEFLIREHKSLQQDLVIMGDITAFYDIEEGILEHNLYGVDINEDAVEIAKLSLWLRTAQKGRMLTNLSGKIKCGNSLIDDKSIAQNAFLWEDEFPEVFEQGGFDVVIGNPPYGATLDAKEWLKNRYKETSFGNIDSYKYFVQKAIEVSNQISIVGFIIPDSYLEKEYFKDVRMLVVANFNKITNIKMGDDVFEDANVSSSIMLLERAKKENKTFNFADITLEKDKETKLQVLVFINEIPDIANTFISKQTIIKNSNNVILDEIYDQVMGVKVYQVGKGKPKQTDYEITNNTFVSKTPFSDNNYIFISQGIERYFYQNQNEFIKYGEWLAEPRKSHYFMNEKIIIREIVNPRIYATYIEEPAVVKNISAVIVQKNINYSLKYLLALMNSKLMTYYIDEQSPKSSNKTYPSFNSKIIKNIPIKNILQEQQEPFIQKAELMLELNKKLQIAKQNFLNELKLDKLTKKLENFDELSFDDFVNEYAKVKKIKFTDKLAERNFKNDWSSLFENDKKAVLELKEQIAKTDNEIDQMVYELYGLSSDEIKVVEGV